MVALLVVCLDIAFDAKIRSDMSPATVAVMVLQAPIHIFVMWRSLNTADRVTRQVSLKYNKTLLPESPFVKFEVKATLWQKTTENSINFFAKIFREFEVPIRRVRNGAKFP